MLLEEEGWEPQLLVSEALSGEQQPLLQPGTPACTFHGVPVALPPPPFPVPCHGHSCTKEPREVTASPTENEGIPAVTGELCLLLTLSEGHRSRGLTPENAGRVLQGLGWERPCQSASPAHAAAASGLQGH